VVDMATGVSRVETPGGRVNALIKNNNSSSGGASKDADKSSKGSLPLGLGGGR
jgi:hypothetical protein